MICKNRTRSLYGIMGGKMKKKFTKPLIMIIAAVILLALAFVILFVSFSDKINVTEKISRDGRTVIFTHETEKGNKLEIPLSARAKEIGEDLYLVNILFCAQTGEKNYCVNHGKIKIALKDSVEIPMMLCHKGASNYDVPNIRYSDDGTKTLECLSDNGYLDINLLLSGEEAENLNFEVGYAVIGKGLYSFNKFYGFGDAFALTDFIASPANP